MPTPLASSNRYALEPGPAQVRSREVDVYDGEVRTERLRWSDDDEIEVRYRDYERGLEIPLPLRIEFTMPEAGWRAEVQVGEYVLDEDLPEELFRVPSAAEEIGRPGATADEGRTSPGM